MWNDSLSKKMEEKKTGLTIFKRLTLGYVLIFSLVTGMVLYAVIQFQSLNHIAGELQKVDRRISDYGEKLTDVLLSEVRYEKKYIITRAPVHLDQFGEFTKDFEEHFGRLTAIAEYPELQEHLVRIRDLHQRYQHLLAEEVTYLKAGRDYAQSRYQREKDKAVAAMMDALEQVVMIAQRNTHRKLNQIESVTAKARTLSLASTGLFLLLGISISFFITRSITRPISFLKDKTKRIAEGNLNGDLELPAVPEIRELADTFNLMCEKLRNLDRLKSEFFCSIPKKVSTPLTSIKERIDLISNELDEILSPNQKVKMAVLAEESTHLVGVVNSMAELSQMESGLTTYYFEPTPLGSVIDQSLKDVARLAQSKEVALKSEGCESLPSIRIDSGKIVQALRTLISNALKPTAKGGSLVVASKAADQSHSGFHYGDGTRKGRKKPGPSL